MRKKFLIFPLLFFALAAILFLCVSSINAAQDVLTLVFPTNCPAGGCAAGQRLNFNLSFTVSPDETGDPNTQVCIYALEDGIEGTGSAPWADETSASISLGTDYTSGETGSVCTNQTDVGDKLLASAHAKLTGSTNNLLDFVLHINRTTNIDGYIKVKIFQLDSGGLWTAAANETELISAAAIAPTAYVGQNPDNCESFSPCYVNSGDDIETGLGTGLRDAVMALDPNATIQILNNYVIKDHTVTVDKTLTIKGYQNATLTYNGTNCNNPMLSFTNGGTLQDITVNDGSNCTNPSRNLVEIESSGDVALLHNTLTSGHDAINIKEGSGNVSVAFNQLSNNTNYAVNNISTGPGVLKIYANNIIDNHSGAQVNCNAHGQADHNYWGEGIPASSSVLACDVNNGKRLGAPILLSSGSPGVEAIERTITGTINYYFNSKIGVRHSSVTDFDAVIVNHGQGSDSNIPFLTFSGAIQACSNFYDVFLLEDAAATNLTISLKYDLNSQCISTIETTDYCAQTDGAKYPLWWYDPANNVTEGWDKTGQGPQGSGAGNATGQTTTCNITNKTITVNIDETGRPGIINDLNFTPFVVGLPVNVASTTTPTITLTPTITRTPTSTLTRTQYPTRTLYPTRTPQPYYQAGTATPGDYPTQIRTYGPSPTGTQTFTANTTLNPTMSETDPFTSGYPVGEIPTIDIPTEGFPASGEEAYPGSTQTLAPLGEDNTNDSDPESAENEPDPGSTVTAPDPSLEEGRPAGNPEEIRWVYLLIGAASGLGLLGAASVLIAKSRLP